MERIRELAPDGVDAAIDSVGTDEAIDTSLELVADRRRIATLAAAQRGLELGIQVLGGAPGADPGTEIRSQARLELVQLADKGLIEVLVVATYPLAAGGRGPSAAGHGPHARQDHPHPLTRGPSALIRRP